MPLFYEDRSGLTWGCNCSVERSRQMWLHTRSEGIWIVNVVYQNLWEMHNWKKGRGLPFFWGGGVDYWIKSCFFSTCYSVCTDYSYIAVLYDCNSDYSIIRQCSSLLSIFDCYNHFLPIIRLYMGSFSELLVVQNSSPPHLHMITVPWWVWLNVTAAVSISIVLK